MVKRYAVSAVFIAALAGGISWARAQSDEQAIPRRPSTPWVCDDTSQPAGTKFRTYFSKTIQKECSYLIYLPPGYEQDQEKRYPVVYWLPGAEGIQTQVRHFLQHLEPAIKSKKAPEMIVVGVQSLKESMYCDNLKEKFCKANLPQTFVKKNAEAIKGRTRIRILVGKNDLTFPQCRKFHELLDKLEIEHEFTVIPDNNHDKQKFYADRKYATFDPFYREAFK